MNVRKFENELKKICSGMKTKYRTVDDGGLKKRVRCFKFPALDVCRKEFERTMGCKIDWPEV